MATCSFGCRTGVMPEAAGSAWVELQGTTVTCSIFGPTPGDAKEYADHGQLECGVCITTFARQHNARGERLADAQSLQKEEAELSWVLSRALSSSVQLNKYPKSVISVQAVVLADDGNALPALVNCASLALADASIELFGLVASCRCSSAGGAATLHAESAELAAATSTLTVACMPAYHQITYVREVGVQSFEGMTDGLQLALKVCAPLHERMQDALRAGKGPGIVEKAAVE